MINVKVRPSHFALSLVCIGVASITLAQNRGPYPMMLCTPFREAL